MPTGNISKINDDKYKARAREIVSSMTLEEKAVQMIHSATELQRLGIPAYNWWNEALHGVARAGVATVFPQAIALAATFNPATLEKTADIISTEGRAKYNDAKAHGDRGIYKGLTFWSPNINIFRDPRWGRGHETYGEDPYLTAELGKAFVRGIQGKDDTHLKAAACAKHYAVHSGPENLRHSFNAVVCDKDLHETYLYAFRECVEGAKVEAIMGAYNRTDGEPCCASETLLKKILRETWGFDGHVTSDCWAIQDINNGHGITKNIEESAAMAVKAGCDLNCGVAFLHLFNACNEGLITQEEIDTSLIRLFTARLRLGLIETTDSECKYDSIPIDAVDCPEHAKYNLEVAKQSLVLLKNDGLLPLKKDRIKSVAVIGPNADNLASLLGNYCGTPSDYYTILRGIRECACEDIRINYSNGCELYRESTSGLDAPRDRFAEAVSCAERSDVVIACMGLDPSLEGEEGDTGNAYASGDKPNLELPGLQLELLQKLHETGKPVILVLVSGSALAIKWADENLPAIVQCFYPGSQGGRAVASLLFGDYSPTGKLPVTFYATSEELPDFLNYDMKGRTYRYMETEALYPFGYGLSYTKFNYGQPQITPKVYNGNIIVSCMISNAGDYDANEVTQMYISTPNAGKGDPKWSLRGIKNSFVKKGQSQMISFVLNEKAIHSYNEAGERVVPSGEYKVYIGSHAPDARSAELSGTKCMEFGFTVK